jgi:hypothetical protein
MPPLQGLRLLGSVLVVFAITQAPLPASRQATNQSAHDNKYKSRATPNNANPPQPTTLVPTQNDGGQSLKSEREARTSNQDHAAVNISNSAPMSEWTRHDKVAWFLAGTNPERGQTE